MCQEKKYSILFVEHYQKAYKLLSSQMETGRVKEAQRREDVSGRCYLQERPPAAALHLVASPKATLGLHENQVHH